LSIAAIVLVLTVSSWPSPLVSDVSADSLLTTADQDTVLALAGVVEDLELELAKQDIRLMQLARERDWYQQKVEDLSPPWWKEVLGDSRLWFILGVTAGAVAVR